MYYNKVEISGVNTAKLTVLKESEKTELLKRVKQGDMAAREELIRGNLRLVLSVIQRFTNRGESADDLFQVGCIGLIKAIDNFDITQQVKFSTYAVPMIMGELRRYLRDNAPVRVSRSMRDMAYKAMQAKEKLITELREYNIELVNTAIENLDFTDEFTDAVEAKQVAEQNKIKAKTEAEQRVIEAEAAAEVKKVEAQAQAEAELIEAEATAEANRLLSESLTAEVLKNKFYEKWNGVLPSVMGNNSVITDISGE